MRTLIYLLMALVFAGLTLWLLSSQLDRIANSSPTSAVIVDVQGRSSERVSSPVVRFTTANGQVIEQAVFRKTRTSIWDKGETLPIRYQPNDPQQVMVNEFRSLWDMTLLCGFLALGFGLLFVRRVLPVSRLENQGLKDLKVLCFVPALFAFVLALQLILV